MTKETQSDCSVEKPIKGHIVGRDELALAAVLSGLMKNTPGLEKKIILYVVRIQFEFLNFKLIPRAQETVGKKKRLTTKNAKKEGHARKNGGDIIPCESAALPF